MKFLIHVFLTVFSLSALAEKFKLFQVEQQICKVRAADEKNVQCFNSAQKFQRVDILESLNIRNLVLSNPQRENSNNEMLKLLSTVIFPAEKISFIQHNYKYFVIKNLAADTKKATRDRRGFETIPFVTTIEIQENTPNAAKETIFIEGLLTYPHTLASLDSIRPPFNQLPFLTRILDFSDGESEKMVDKTTEALVNEIVGPAIVNEVFLKPFILLKSYMLQEMLEKLEKTNPQQSKNKPFLV